LYSVYTVLSTDIIFGKKHYFGWVFVGVCIISAAFNKKIGIYITGITLLIGTFNVIAFTPTIEAYSFGFGINDASATSFKIQSFSFIIFLLYLILNGRFLIRHVKKTI
jgi:hypothetical protein